MYRNQEEGKVSFRHHFQKANLCKGLNPFTAQTWWHAGLSPSNGALQHSLLLHPITRWVLRMIIIGLVSL